MLAYYPTRRLSDSDFRHIEVKVKHPPSTVQFPPASETPLLQVRHRTGYYTSQAQ